MKMDIEVIRRVCLARHLYGLAKGYVGSTNDLYLFSAVNFLQDAVEAYLLALADFLNAQIDQRTTFDRYFILINEKIAPRELPFKSQLMRLNRIRVDSKHYGIQPARDELQRLEVSVGEFFTESSEAVLDASFATLSAIDLMNDGETKECLLQAVQDLTSGNLDNCAIACRKALYLEIEYRYDISPFREGAEPRYGLRLLAGTLCHAPYYTRNAQYIEKNVKCPTDYIAYDPADLHQYLSIHRVDNTAYWNIWRLTPEVFKDENSNWFVKRDFDKLDHEILADKIQYILDTSINIVFSIHSVKNTVRTGKYQNYSLDLAREGIPVYEKTSRASKHVGNTPSGLLKLDCDHYIYGFEGDGPYWQVRDFSSGNYLVGYVHNDDLAKIDSKEIHNGEVKWFDSDKGFGFIVDDDGKEVFVHASGVLSSEILPLKPRQRVSYKLEDAKRGPKAMDVELFGS